MAIQSFSNKNTEEFFITDHIRKGLGWANVSQIAKRKIDMVHYAAQMDDLRAPPGNKLEALMGNLNGFYNTRINEQWRVLFRWSESGPSDVMITDYH